MKRYILILFVFFGYVSDGQSKQLYDKLRQTQSQEVIAGFDSGIILNGVFDNADDISFNSARYDVVGGTLNFNASAENQDADFTLSEPVVSGGDYEIGFTVVSGTARLRLSMLNETNQITGSVIYAVGSHTVTYSHSDVNRTIFTIRSRNGGGGEAYSLDDLYMIKTNFLWWIILLLPLNFRLRKNKNLTL